VSGGTSLGVEDLSHLFREVIPVPYYGPRVLRVLIEETEPVEPQSLLVDFTTQSFSESLSVDMLVRELKHPVIQLKICITLGWNSVYSKEIQARPESGPLVTILKDLLRFRDVKGICARNIKQIVRFPITGVGFNGVNSRVQAIDVAT
jgi:hypothetical protein